MASKKKRGGTYSTDKKKNKNYYFTKVHEDAIIRYNETDDPEERSALYETYIQPAFSEMVDKITYTYKFTTLPNIDVLRDECKIWLTTLLGKYDPDKCSKAFSYFSVITKHWFIHAVKKNAKQARKETVYEDLEKTSRAGHDNLVTRNMYLEETEWREFMNFLFLEMDKWEKELVRPNEQKVILAIRDLFDRSDDIPIFNKKAVYLMLRENTGLNTKQVVNNLNKLRKRYREFKAQWEENGE